MASCIEKEKISLIDRAFIFSWGGSIIYKLQVMNESRVRHQVD